MALTSFHPVVGSYNLVRLNSFKQFEGSRPEIYFDSAANAHPTIGIGLNLDDPAVRARVFREMGITDPVHIDDLTAMSNRPKPAAALLAIVVRSRSRFRRIRVHTVRPESARPAGGPA